MLKIDKKVLEELAKSYELGLYERVDGFNKRFLLPYLCCICWKPIKEDAIRIKYENFLNFYLHEECLKNFKCPRSSTRIEHWPPKPGVEGSNPSGGVNEKT